MSSFLEIARRVLAEIEEKEETVHYPGVMARVRGKKKLPGVTKARIVGIPKGRLDAFVLPVAMDFPGSGKRARVELLGEAGT